MDPAFVLLVAQEAASVAAAAEAGMPVWQIVAQLGLSIVLVMLFVFWMKEEKKGLINRIEKVSDQMTEIQATVIKENTVALSGVKDSSDRQTKVLEGLAKDIQRLDCMRRMHGTGD